MSKVEFYFKSFMVFLCFLFVILSSMGIWGVLGEDVVWKGLATICVCIVGTFCSGIFLGIGGKNETGN